MENLPGVVQLEKAPGPQKPREGRSTWWILLLVKTKIFVHHGFFALILSFKILHSNIIYGLLSFWHPLNFALEATDKS